MKHPARYPKHDSDKGTIWGGKCNRTACNTLGAVNFNASTMGYYCHGCAGHINVYSPPCCVPVDHDLTLAEMDDLAARLSEAIKPQGG